MKIRRTKVISRCGTTTKFAIMLFLRGVGRLAAGKRKWIQENVLIRKLIWGDIMRPTIVSIGGSRFIKSEKKIKGFPYFFMSGFNYTF